MSQSILPNAPANIEQLRTSASRFETPCGDGSLVWHCWGGGQPVVLLHGGSGSWTHWVRNITALVENNCRVIAADLPGFGDSALPPDGRDGDVMPHWLETGLNQILGDQACTIVGFSFGAMVGTLMAAQFAQRVNRLVLVGAPALSDIPMPRMRLQSWEKLAPGEERNSIVRDNLATLMIADPANIDDLAIRIHETNIPRDRLRTRRLPITNIVVKTLPRIQCSVAGIWGIHDAVYKDRLHTIEPALMTAPNFTGLTIIENAGHWVQYESANQFNLTLRELLE
jgi:pimeloyl-ACP methyl ester carboxylesterase